MSDEFMHNYVEHIVPLKEPSKILPKKLGLIFFAFLLVVGVFAFALSNLAFVPIVAAVLIIVAYVIWYLWRFVSIEYEYVIHHGEITFDVVYGRKQRKQFYKASLARVEKIAPLVDGKVPEADAQGAAKEVFCVSKRSSRYAHYAVVREEDGSKTILLFELIERGEKVLRFFNSAAFR